jgi:putative transposase
MLTVFKMLLAALRHLAGSRANVVLENLALRQQVAVLKRERPRPSIADIDRAFRVAMRDEAANWADALIIVQPATVVKWHKNGFKRWWRWKSRRRRLGRPRVPLETRALIRRMALDNGWRAPRIHKELALLGIEVSEVSVRKYLPRRPHRPGQLESWMKFLRLHADEICAMDFLVVPSATFKVLYGFFVIHHGTRKVLHFNVTEHPTALWVIQQLREAFGWDSAPDHLICDNDTIFSAAVAAAASNSGTKICRTGYRSPWQNGVAERWVGTFRHELLDYVVVLGANHLRRLGNSYIAYYNEDRPHIFLEGSSPAGRLPVPRSSPSAEVVALPRASRFHHRYEWRDAA